jgi:predicted GNAT family N-acyltransferase
MNAKKQTLDILHMNKIEANRSTLKTNGHIDIKNIEYKTLQDFYKKVPFIRLGKKYDDYTIHSISFI